MRGVPGAHVETSRCALRIAIVGCGPRGLQCLESLSRHLETSPDRVEIDIYETSLVPGAGAVYDPAQSEVLKMNFAVENVNFWNVSSDAQVCDGESLLQWLERNCPKLADPNRYVPRKIVGQYLSDCFDTVHRRLSRRAKLRLIRESVREVNRDSTSHCSWTVTATGEKTDYDQVALTTGHGGLRRNPSLRGCRAAFAYEYSDKPVDNQDVLIRGFGLTAIDACLLETEGRGGRFINDDGRPGYRPSGEEADSLTIVSRTGRPMLAKPAGGVAAVPAGFWQPYQEALRGRMVDHGRLGWIGGLCDIVYAASAGFLSFHGQDTTPIDCQTWFARWSSTQMHPGETVGTLRHSLRVATGDLQPDIAMAIAQSWRCLYPQMVDLISYGGLESRHWRDFDHFAREMERIAFGPPPENVEKLLCLLDCGRLKLHRPFDVAPGRYDRIIDAVISGPHDHTPDGPLRRLLAEGVVRADETTGGIIVDGCGRASADGNLSVFGRATEGWILGNDTLNRTLHPQVERWAEWVAKYRRNNKCRGSLRDPTL